MRYEPPGRASNPSNLALIPPGGSHAASASGSTRAAKTRPGGAAISRKAVSVRGTTPSCRGGPAFLGRSRSGTAPTGGVMYVFERADGGGWVSAHRGHESASAYRVGIVRGHFASGADDPE